MEISEIIRNTRLSLNMSLRRFGEQCYCTGQAVRFWELGCQNPPYEKMYYVYTHAPLPQLREMAGQVMRKLDTAKWIVDTGKGEDQEQTVITSITA